MEDINTDIILKLFLIYIFS